MQNSKQSGLETQVNRIWSKFQARRTSNQIPPQPGEALPPALATEPLEDRGNPAEVVAISNIPARDLFSEALAPISKLNLPAVNVDPWSAFWAVLAAMVGGTGITSYLLLIAVPPTPSCQGIVPVATDSERLFCAQVGAETREVPKLRAAVELVKDWNDRHPLHRESQRLLKEWSQDLIRIGRKQFDEGNIAQAIATLRIVPITSPSYDLTQETIAKWSIQAQKSAAIDGNFTTALKSGDWGEAFAILQSVQRMRGNYWNDFKHDKMASKLAKERDAWEKLQEAKDALLGTENESYAKRARRIELAVKAAASRHDRDKDKVVEVPLPDRPEPIVTAMKLANQIDPTTYVYHEGQTLRSKWSKHLVQLSISAYKAQSYNAAIAIVQKVPQDVSVYQEAQDWAKLNQAQVWASKRHTLAMLDAIAQVKKIPKTSSIYTLARTQRSQWQGMLKQQTQLQWAKTIASFQQPATLAMAIDTAKHIPAESESGRAIQSDVNTWSRQIETIDNRVILAKARQIISRGETLINLKAAVKLAGKIGKDRPLGEEITEAVGGWTEKIQTIEDRPILLNALSTASQGNLSQAIEIANRIAPGRSLYAEAQAEARYWRLELQEIADRRTLNRAIEIYRQGKISSAIELATTIGRRSPIYSDARTYASEWRLLLTPRSARN
jgi:hypothetical protein